MKESEISTERANKELDQFVYYVSHDLKAPLRAISNLALWIREDVNDVLTDEARKNFDMLRSRVARMEAMIQGISEYARIEGRSTYELVNVSRLLSEVLAELAVPPHINIEITQVMPVLRTSKKELQKVFFNLIDNAIKYNNKPEGKISVYSEEKDDHYEFIVEDNGPGIPADSYEKIFMIFQTLHSKDKFESAGVGLTTAKKIVEKYGGQIHVESTVGKGSRFIFTWPNLSEHQS